jgi:uncharacterized membrane protein YraQ (UPF0718 family)
MIPFVPAGWEPALMDSWSFFLHLAVVLVPMFIGGSFLVGLAGEYLPPEKVEQKLRGHDEGIGNVLASAFGAVTPFCSCSTVPALAGLLQAGAPLGLAFSFLLASPLVNEIAVILLLGWFGPKVTVAYVASTFTLAVVGGLVIGWLDLEDYIKNVELLTSSEESAAADGGISNREGHDDAGEREDRSHGRTWGDRDPEGQPPLGFSYLGEPGIRIRRLRSHEGLRQQARHGRLRHAQSRHQSERGPDPSRPQPPQREHRGTPSYDDEDGGCGDVVADSVDPTHRQKITAAAQDAWSFFIDTLPYLFLGMIIGALIHGVVPVEMIHTVLGENNPLAVPLAALAGAPVYVSMSGMLPIAASLSEQGIAIGTVLAFVIGGAGVSIPNLILLNKLFERRLLAVYVATVVTIGTVVGGLFNLFLI